MAFGLWIILVIAAVFIVVIIPVIYYNRFKRFENRIDNSLSQIDVQLRRRGELVPNLIETVKGYAKHEKKIIEDVTKARAAMMGAGELQERINKGNQLQSALKSIFALAENYPQLKANENFLQLQQELAAIEDKIAYSRQYYNDSILTYNNSVETFPGNFFAGIFGHKEKQFLDIPVETRAVPKVKFE